MILFKMIQSKVVRQSGLGNYTLGKTYDITISSDRLNFQIRNDAGEINTLSHVLIDYKIFVDVHKLRDDKLKQLL